MGVQTLIVCPGCGGSIDARLPACPGCGRCPNCGRLRLEKLKVCPDCGIPFCRCCGRCPTCLKLRQVDLPTCECGHPHDPEKLRNLIEEFSILTGGKPWKRIGRWAVYIMGLIVLAILSLVFGLVFWLLRRLL